MRLKGFFALSVLLVTAACGDDDVPDDAGLGSDGAAQDAAMDSAVPADSTVPLDSSSPEDAATDATETVDSASGDANAPLDSGELDGGDLDSGNVDAATAADAGSDAGQDAGSDSGADAGMDAGPTCPGPTSPPTLATENIAGAHVFDAPVLVLSPPGDPDSLFVVQKGGTVVVVQSGSVRPTPFITVSGLLTSGEQGLLGMAFHPDYASNGRFFLYFTPSGPRRNVVAEFARSAGDPYVADSAEVARLVSVTDSESNHNGGMIAFGPDGYLYAGLGDEGGGGDDHGTIGNALDRTNLFGSMLRLDVDNMAGDYAAPGNPFTMPTGQPQIWAYGLRNPWRFSFDSLNGDLYIGDVGQGRWEEVTILEPSDPGGANLGWRAYEGNAVYSSGDLDLVPVHAAPQMVYRQDRSNEVINSGCAIVGGYVYRGSAISGLDGWYFFGDNCSLTVGAFRKCESEAIDVQRVTDLTAGGGMGADSAWGLASFGEDGHSELYMAFVGSGHVKRIIAP